MSQRVIRRNSMGYSANIDRQRGEPGRLRTGASWSCLGCQISLVIKVIIIFIIVIVVISVFAIRFLSIRELVISWNAGHAMLLRRFVQIFHIFWNNPITVINIPRSRLGARICPSTLSQSSPWTPDPLKRSHLWATPGHLLVPAYLVLSLRSPEQDLML